ncbi:AAA family ATPase [Bacillus mangrovi]|uniref:AAA family ATPase n=1 Tax=Metabacillus mangrovi TaxID=1491830 RepID=A0A7X2S531_9BACI|nr:AAA family ATPase [Metabacillus mangrovi]MTH53381.1 AAA family ATPase [Metabacillus mangrovi]
MKLKECIIYGYGQFIGKHILIGEGRSSLFYGQNEAGKSTIMSFIHSILFGLPQKNHPDSKYEPKNGEVFGGTVVAEIKDTGLVRIERVRGKSGGNAVISLPGGRTAGEELLKEWLGGLDRTFYQAVFSFDLHGLQQIEKVKEEEIGKFLYMTSMVGTDAVYKLEQRLSKEQDRLFKPNGKKPVLNEKLAELKQTADALKQASIRNSEYEDMLNQKAEADEEAGKQETRLQTLRQKQSQLSRAVSLLPLFHEQNAIKEELRELPDTSRFPAEGLSRLERLKTEMEPVKARTSRMEAQLRELTEKADGLQPEMELLHKEAALQELKDQIAGYEASILEKETLTFKVQTLVEEAETLSADLYGTSMDYKELAAVDTSVSIKTAVQELSELSKTLVIQKAQLDEQFDRAREALDLSEERCASLTEERMAPAERAFLEQELAELEKAGTGKKAEDLQNELRDVEQELASHKKQAAGAKRRLTAGILVILLILSAGFIWSVLNGQWAIAGLLAAAAAAAGFLFQNKGSATDSLAAHLQKRKRMLEEELRRAERPESMKRAEELKGRLWKDEQVKQMAEVEKQRAEQESRVCDRVIAKYEEWEKEQFRLNEKAKPVLKNLLLPETMNVASLSRTFQLIEECKSKISDWQKAEKQLEAVKGRLALFEGKASGVLPAAAGHESLSQRIYGLLNAARQENEKQTKRAAVILKMEEIQEEHREQIHLLLQKQEEFKNLLSHAGAVDEEAFRELSGYEQKRSELNRQHAWIRRQLEGSQAAENMQEHDWIRLEEKLQEASLQTEQTEKRLKELQERASVLHTKLHAIEEDGSYSDRLHEYGLQQEDARQTAKEWLVKTAARDFLLRTIDYHRTVRMPKLIRQTVVYFKELTEGRYVNVFLPEEEQTFIAERADGSRFKAGELSQATSEQLYLSLRLALAAAMNEQLQLPILIDDGFVHFDSGRTEKMLELLTSVSAGQQVLLFTCQEHIASRFKGHVTILERAGATAEAVRETTR